MKTGLKHSLSLQPGIRAPLTVTISLPRLLGAFQNQLTRYNPALNERKLVDRALGYRGYIDRDE